MIFDWQGVRDMVVKIDRHGQASVLTSDEIELLFNNGFLTDRVAPCSGCACFQLAELPKPARC